jgi:malonyl-CoA O-methyltransferase
MDTDTLILNYSSVKKILLDLKAVGAHNQNLGRANGLMGKTRLSGMYQAYEIFRTKAGFPASYEVLYGHAWNPKTPMQMTQSGGDGSEQETRISLAQLKSNLRVKERS